MAEGFLKNYPVKECKNLLVIEDTPPKNILFLGDDNVGKTTFITRYCEYIRDFYRCDIFEGAFLAFTQFHLFCEPFGRRLPVRFLDLPAGTTVESRRDQYPAPTRVDLIVLCFALNDLDSFAHVKEIWLPELRRYYPNFQRFFLLGLKEDTRLEMLATDIVPVTFARGRQFHREQRFSGNYLECSVEENPLRARTCMDILVGYAFADDMPRVPPL